mgnify:CR=1 FL=1
MEHVEEAAEVIAKPDSFTDARCIVCPWCSYSAKTIIPDFKVGVTNIPSGYVAVKWALHGSINHQEEFKNLARAHTKETVQFIRCNYELKPQCREMTLEQMVEKVTQEIYYDQG